MMKYLQYLLVLTGAMVILFSCQKEYSVENGNGGNTGPSQWQFKDSTNTLFKGPIDTAFIDTIGPNLYLTIEGKSDDGRDVMTLQVFATEIKAGTYITPSASFDYTRNGSIYYQSDIQAIGDFTIVVTSKDSASISGTFYGKVKDAAGASRSIKEGKFNARFKKGGVVNPPPPVTDSGQVMLWSKSGCGGGTSTTPISVFVGSKNGSITSFTATEPATCGATGTYTVKLAVGTYNWKAKCGSDSIGSTVTVTKDGCTKVEVNFAAPPPAGDYFPITTNSNWSYTYEGFSDTLYVLSLGTTKTFNGNPYNIFRNTDGSSADSSYYRKGGGLYYEYLADASGQIFTNPVAVEHIFLKDNVPAYPTAGSTWSLTFSGTIQGQAIQGKIQDTVYQKGVSATVGTTTYTDVIKVRTGYFIAPPLVPAQLVYYVDQWFARGKGLIKYSDYDPFSATGSVMNLKRAQVY